MVIDAPTCDLVGAEAGVALNDRRTIR